MKKPISENATTNNLDSTDASKSKTGKAKVSNKKRLYKLKSFWILLFLCSVMIVVGLVWFYQRPFLSAQWNKWFEPEKAQKITVAEQKVDLIEEKMQKLEQLFSKNHANYLASVEMQAVKIKQQESQIKLLKARLRRIEERQLKPSNLLPLIDNHLYLIQQQLVFDYDQVHIERQLNVVFDLLTSFDDPDLVGVISTLSDFREKFIDLPRFNVTDLIKDVDVLIIETKNYKLSSAEEEQLTIHADSLTDYFKKRLSELIVVEKNNQEQVDWDMDLNTRIKWVVLQLENIKLRLLLRDWALVNEQSASLRLWLQEHNSDLYARLNPVLSRLQFIFDKRERISLNEVRSQVNQILKARK